METLDARGTLVATPVAAERRIAGGLTESMGARPLALTGLETRRLHASCGQRGAEAVTGVTCDLTSVRPLAGAGGPAGADGADGALA